MKQLIPVTINGEPRELAVEPFRSLLDALRHEAGLTGTKKGCDVGDCGACTVILDGKPVNACLVLAVEVRDSEIVTIEGVQQGEKLHPLQEAFMEHHGMQCGYCTPGMIIAAKSLLDHNPEPTELEVRQAIGGHLCRCGTYVRIVKSILHAAELARNP